MQTKTTQKEDIKKLLGANIKSIRKARKMTQEQLAEMVDIAPPNISYIENGKFAPSIETLQKIACALGVEPYELYRFNRANNTIEIKQELFDALDKDDRLLYLLYKIFKAIRFSV